MRDHNSSTELLPLPEICNIVLHNFHSHFLISFHCCQKSGGYELILPFPLHVIISEQEEKSMQNERRLLIHCAKVEAIVFLVQKLEVLVSSTPWKLFLWYSEFIPADITLNRPTLWYFDILLCPNRVGQSGIPSAKILNALLRSVCLFSSNPDSRLVSSNLLTNSLCF